jgi:hypothetical protein
MADNEVLRPESGSEEEKATGTQHDGVAPPKAYTADLSPDPDAHLSPEERAAIVSTYTFKISNLCSCNITGSQIALETRLNLNSMGKKSNYAAAPHFADEQLCILYLLAFLDRTNIGNAKIDGLQKSLHNMSTGRYNATLSIFFVSYSIFEPITNILLKRMRPSIFIPLIMYAVLLVCLE